MPKLPRVYSAFDPAPDAGIDCSVEPSMTQQNFKAECDINNILARYQETGFIDDSLRSEIGQFADIASAVDYHTAQNLISVANEVFLELPLKVRRRFNNNPADFLAFIDDPSNYDEAKALGLLKPDIGAAEGAAPRQEAGGDNAATPPSGAS